MARLHILSQVALAVICVAQPQVRLSEEAGPITVHVHCVDAWGHALTYARLEISTLGGAPKVTRGSCSQALWSLPAGKYAVGATAPGFERADVHVQLVRSGAWITISLTPWANDLSRQEVTVAGRVTPAKPSGVSWVKLLPVYGGMPQEAPVTEEGYFLFEPDHLGKYLLILLNDDRIVSVKPLDVRLPYTRVELDVSPH